MHRLKVLSSGLLRGNITAQLPADTLQVTLQWPSQNNIYKGYRIRTGSGWSSRVISADPHLGRVVVEDQVQAIPGEIIELDTAEEVPVFAARLLTETTLDKDFPPLEMKLGSTRGTNAILERKGARTALIVTRGFKDLLVIGTQQRPDLFALDIRKPPVYYERVIELDERIAADGSVVRAPGEETIQNIIGELKASGVESIAVALLNSYKNPSHELNLATRIAKAGFSYVSLSSSLSSQVRILPRAETAVANAYLLPVIGSYMAGIRKSLNRARLKVMASYGGLIDAEQFQPKDSLLSGPAGGVTGAAIKAKLSGIDRLITFDMGGTSTDVSLYDKRFDYRFESKVGPMKILAPSLSIETIAAGGGSICNVERGILSVGPQSAGADPGPACYGRGGPLTLTDVNLLLGRVDAGHFAIPLSMKEAAAAFEHFCAKAGIGKSQAVRQQTLLSLVRIANEKMAGAIGRVSTHVGQQPGEFTLLSFGGAGGQHACELAEILNMNQVLIPYDAGLLSAFGIGQARVQHFREQLLLEPLKGSAAKVALGFDVLIQRATDELLKQGYAMSSISVSERLIFIRFGGQENVVELKIAGPGISEEELLRQFKKRYVRIFGHWMEDQLVEIESIRVSVEVVPAVVPAPTRRARRHRPAAGRTLDMITASGTMKAYVYRWEDLRPGATLKGPALVVSGNSSTVVSPGWEFSLDIHNNALLKRKLVRQSREKYSPAATLELFTNRFTAIAQQMGAMLQRTSFSVNVKERLDFSCAVLDERGYLVVNAPHIPVHLGSLGICVREVVKKIHPRKGDVIITNHPAFGGSHLPDITLIKPVYAGKRLIGYVANRAHHAEIGGTRPGSMPADARTLEEEGVIIEPCFLVRNGKIDWRGLTRLFTKSKYPTRSWSENQADLIGALASIRFGEELLLEQCRRYGEVAVRENMRRLRRHAATIFKDTLKIMRFTKLQAIERLDDGSALHVTIQKVAGKLIMDFSGSSAAHPGNLNATCAIVQSVALYVIRLLVNKPIPMNEGLMDHVKLILPEGLLNPDFSGARIPAVVGGNTEVSQRLTDTLLKAFGMAACSQGTMNNFLFGNDKLGYYETICGGTGAGKGFDGASAVHQHMTNTRITDPELLELRYPVSLERFEVRQSSGGDGQWRGGDGVVREVKFRERLEVSLLSQHRKERPYGIAGGGEGKEGRQWIVRRDGSHEELNGIDNVTAYPGDCIVIETPGGGGYGRARKQFVATKSRSN